jgi:hybrid cluster-associated redox disulfide protein
MCVADILTLLPDAAPLLARYGLSCFSCSANSTENLEDGCRSHGFSDEDIQDLVTDLNEMLHDRPERPQTLTLTEDGARALLGIMKDQGKLGEMLAVGLDERGGFCMEFQKDASQDDRKFQNSAVPEVTIVASSLTLAGIGGSTIDFRDGRFKLDLPGAEKKNCACGKGDACGCEGGECGCH